MGGQRMTAAQHEGLWERYQAGETVAVIARQVGRAPHATINDRIRQHGGIRPSARRRAADQLALDEREISREPAAGDSLR